MNSERAVTESWSWQGQGQWQGQLSLMPARNSSKMGRLFILTGKISAVTNNRKSMMISRQQELPCVLDRAQHQRHRPSIDSVNVVARLWYIALLWQFVRGAVTAVIYNSVPIRGREESYMHHLYPSHSIEPLVFTVKSNRANRFWSIFCRVSNRIESHRNYFWWIWLHWQK